MVVLLVEVLLHAEPLIEIARAAPSVTTGAEQEPARIADNRRTDKTSVKRYRSGAPWSHPAGMDRRLSAGLADESRRQATVGFGHEERVAIEADVDCIIGLTTRLAATTARKPPVARYRKASDNGLWSLTPQDAVTGQFSSHLDVDRRVRVRPDIVWTVNGAPAAVIDAKYKAETPSGYPNADKYQMLAYCTVLSLADGHLIYAEGGDVGVAHTVRNTGVTIHSHSLDLDVEPAELLAGVDDLAERIATGALATPAALPFRTVG